MSSALKVENKAIRSIERCYLKHSSVNIHLALEDSNLVWDTKKVLKVIMLWNEGLSVHDICKKVSRPIEDLVPLLVDIALKGQLKEREGGIFGNLANQ